MKKVGKTTRPFRYDLNQIPYDYTVEVRNRFKGLDPIDRVPDELQTEVRDIVQEAVIKTIPLNDDGTVDVADISSIITMMRDSSYDYLKEKVIKLFWYMLLVTITLLLTVIII